ncbi:hypothetical protein F5Y10DRAFT_237408 [Nemania abortiva]|nr:hypothetical protein F5Y10DRAFT_237408 [Nemania abortiva]
MNPTGQAHTRNEPFITPQGIGVGKDEASTPQNTGAGEAQASGSAYPKTDVTATGLSVVYEPEGVEPVLDIIFVHGLQGHPFKTWAVEVGHQNFHGGKLPPQYKGKALDDGPIQNKQKSLLTRLWRFKRVRNSTPREEGSYVFWPGDLLPAELPEARILVFGYDTVIAKHQFAGAVNKNSIFAHSKDLVNELSRARPLARPVLFVTHSLGGIVVKESLAVCSTSNSEDIEDILKSTTGVVFLGTPHRGSTAAGAGEIARKAASLLLMDTNSRVLDSLSLRNSDLERCQDVFSSLWFKYNFQVKTFQEGLPLKLPIRLGQSKMVKVVPDVSSCLGDSRERAETLDGDHRSMCRYIGTQDPNYKKVAAELRAIYTNLTSKALTPVVDRHLPEANLTHDDQGKLEHLKFAEALFRQLSIAAPADNTCHWLLDTASFNTWIERRNIDSHLGLLQIIGKPGSGKSTLMKSAFEVTRARFRENTNICVLCHFFDRRGQLLQHSATGVVRSLLYQLGIQYPASLAVFQDYTQANLRVLESSDSTSYLDILKSNLERIFSTSSLAPQRTIIFVDALDECDSSDAINMGYFLAQLTRKAHNNGVQLDVCISRREYPSITVKGSLEIHMETYNDVDIRHYMHQKFELANISDEDRETLIRTIFERSNGIFLWVVLAVDGILKDVENGENIKYILKRTESLPKSLESLYEQIIADIDPENRMIALRLFEWAILATDRLRVREWHHILAFIREKPPASLREWRNSDYYTKTDAQLERRIRNLSQGLVEVKGFDDTTTSGDFESLRAGAGSLDSTLGDSRVVQPIHETVTEFFISGRANCLHMKYSSYDFLGGGHLSITSTCLAYLSISEFDGLIKARRQIEASRGRAKNKSTIQNKSHLRRNRSATSFMSSASSHSGKYRFQEDDDEQTGTDVEDEEAARESDSLDFRGLPLPPQLPLLSPEMIPRNPQPSTPKEFADLFPSGDYLTIQHADFASDSNMNLTVETLMPDELGRRFQLFHLRMYDLSKRRFSLRRYCRDSGCEVSQSRRKYVGPDNRPILQRSFTEAIKRLGDRSTDRQLEPDIVDARRSLAATAGYSPWVSVDNNISDTKDLQPTDLIRLEFKNYTTIEIQYVNSRKTRSYQFGYWGTEYSWNRVLDEDSVSFHLFRGSDREDPVATIDPVAGSPERIAADRLAGAWVPPHLMRLIDSNSFKNAEGIADVIMATGLTILVDDRIREEWEEQRVPRRALRRPRNPYKSPYANHAVNIGPSLSNSTLSRSSVADSAVSQMLEEYPALTSYALNRAFEHARAGLARGADPGEVLRKLVLEECWERWYTLQESVSGPRSWIFVLEFQGLAPWIRIAAELLRGREASTATSTHGVSPALNNYSE